MQRHKHVVNRYVGDGKIWSSRSGFIQYHHIVRLIGLTQLYDLDKLVLILVCVLMYWSSWQHLFLATVRTIHSSHICICHCHVLHSCHYTDRFGWNNGASWLVHLLTHCCIQAGSGTHRGHSQKPIHRLHYLWQDSKLNSLGCLHHIAAGSWYLRGGWFTKKYTAMRAIWMNTANFMLIWFNFHSQLS